MVAVPVREEAAEVPAAPVVVVPPERVGAGLSGMEKLNAEALPVWVTVTAAVEPGALIVTFAEVTGAGVVVPAPGRVSALEL